MKISSHICPICESSLESIEPSERDTYKINCKRCGNYKITDDALILYQRSDLTDKILSVSYWIRQHQTNDKKSVYIELKSMRSLLVPFIAPKPNEQANNLLLWMGNNLKKLSDETDIEYSNLIAILGCYDVEDIYVIIKYLVDSDFIVDAFSTSEQTGKYFWNATMTFKGWERYEELKRTSKDSRLVFMAMQYDNFILQEIYEKIIKEAVSKTGFEIRKLDDIKKTGLIDDKLRVAIRRSKFIIADLTDENRGAYWEAGYAEGLGLQVIYICEKEKFDKLSTHFDTNHHLTVKWKDDPDSLVTFAEELKATIRATFPTEAKMED